MRTILRILAWHCMTVVLTGVGADAFAGVKADSTAPRVPVFRHTYALGLSYPEKVRAGISGILTLNRSRWRRSASGAGILLQAEPGVGGVRFGIGYGFVASVRMFTDRGLGFMGHMGIPWFGYALKAVLLRTAYSSWDVAPGQTYFGAGAQVNVLLLNVDVNLLRHVAGESRDHPWLVAWGVGVGF